jgi:hypothetical protein
MIPETWHELLEKLTDLQQLSPDVRFGQLMANFGFLVEDQTDQRSGRSTTLGSCRSWRSIGSTCCNGNQPMPDPALNRTRPNATPPDQFIVSFDKPTRRASAQAT